MRKNYKRNLANKKHLAILEKGVPAWDEWRKKNPYIKPDFGWADLSGADLSGADLREANLRGANLRGANLEEVKHLTLQQLDQARTNEKTILPDYFRNK